jgi:tetratricopeptide (TPR) repeat protein
MEIESNSSSIKRTIETLNKKSFEDYKEWVDNSLKMNQYSSIFFFLILQNFIKSHGSSLGFEKYFYLEKFYFCALELKLIDVARKTLREFKQEFGNEPKIRRMEAQLLEIDNPPQNSNIDFLTLALESYKTLMKFNQEDRSSIKKYLSFIKLKFDFEGLKTYCDLWNEYLKVYMDDYEAWYELSDVYIQTGNFNKAIYCLEEVLLHQPNNFKIYIKIGDIFNSLNNCESAVLAIKYYSQSILIKPTPRAFWGIVYSINIYSRTNKPLTDQKIKNLLKIAKVSLNNFYANSPLKFALEQFYDIKEQ